MSGDYKYAAQLLAEEMALTLHGQDFYSLPDAEQMRIYGIALLHNAERRMNQAESYADIKRDEGKL